MQFRRLSLALTLVGATAAIVFAVFSHRPANAISVEPACWNIDRVLPGEYPLEYRLKNSSSTDLRIVGIEDT